MGFFSKGKLESPEERKAVQEVAMRTMQQDLSVAKKGELTGQTRMESVERHGGNLRPEKTIARVAPPVAPVALPHLAEMEHKREKPVSSDVPEIKAIPIVPFAPVGVSSSIPEMPKAINIPTPPSKPVQRSFFSEHTKIARPAEISKVNDFTENPTFAKPSVPLPPTKPENEKSIKLESSKDNKQTETPKLQSKINTPLVKKKFSINRKKATWGLVGGIAVVAIAIGVYFVAIPMFFAPESPTVVIDNQEIPNVSEEPIVIPELPDIPNVPEIIENDFKLMNFDLEYDIDISQDEFIDFYQNDLSLVIAEKLNTQDLALAQEFVDIQFSLDQEFPSAEMVVNSIFNGFPQDILDRMTSKYNLVAYTEGESGRLGLILEVNDVQSVKEILLDWEQTIVDELTHLYLDNSLDVNKASSEDFIENVYSGVSIKYINFPSPDSSLEYAIAGNKLIFSTSKNSTFSLIDRANGTNGNNGNDVVAEMGEDILNEESN